jgi:hypothetical protein
MTFTEYLSSKKGIQADGKDLNALMDEYFDEYQDFLRGVKDVCGPKD